MTARARREDRLDTGKTVAWTFGGLLCFATYYWIARLIEWLV